MRLKEEWLFRRYCWNGRVLREEKLAYNVVKRKRGTWDSTTWRDFRGPPGCTNLYLNIQRLLGRAWPRQETRKNVEEARVRLLLVSATQGILENLISRYVNRFPQAVTCFATAQTPNPTPRASVAFAWSQTSFNYQTTPPKLITPTCKSSQEFSKRFWFSDFNVNLFL